MTFQYKLDNIVAKNNSLVCVGLDSNFSKIPKQFKEQDNPQFEFNKWIIEQTHDLVCAYKPNSAFYEARGVHGIAELKQTCDYLRAEHPEIIIILDAKRADIGNTNEGYLDYAFEYLGVDAITLHPYLGSEAISNFLAKKNKGCIILCRTSNPGAGELQDLTVTPGVSHIGSPGVEKESLYKHIARKAAQDWNKHGNVLLVVGATYPDELAQIREIVGDMNLLVPGIGDQGGDVKKTMEAGLNSKNSGLIVNSSRGIIFSDNPREETKKLKQKINDYR